jgi:hypothetical protein
LSGRDLSGYEFISVTRQVLFLYPWSRLIISSISSYNHFY